MEQKLSYREYHPRTCPNTLSMCFLVLRSMFEWCGFARQVLLHGRNRPVRILSSRQWQHQVRVLMHETGKIVLLVACALYQQSGFSVPVVSIVVSMR